MRSFADADGDGLGDLRRHPFPPRRTSPASASTRIWLNPFYPSPQADAGYDVADYRDVDPRFGTLADFDGLVADAHARGPAGDRRHRPQPHLRRAPVVPGRAGAGPGSAERARYLFRDGRGPDGDEPPNDWHSVFGGPAWTRVTEAGRAARPVVPAPVRPRAARPRLDQRRGARRSSSRSCASGSTAASTGSASTSPTAWPRTRTSPTSPAASRPTGRPSAGHPALGPRRGARRLPAVARGQRRATTASAAFVAEAWVDDPGPARPLPAARRAAHRLQLRLPARRRGTPTALRRRHRRAASTPSAGSAPRRRGCCPTTTSSATSPATAAATAAGDGPGPRPC